MNVIYLAWVTEGDYGDAEPLAARKTGEGAKRWCNEHRKSEGGAPLTWKRYKGKGTFTDEPGTFANSTRKGSLNLHYEVHAMQYEDD